MASGCSARRRPRTRLSCDKGSEGIGTGFEVLVFFRKVLNAPFEAGNVTGWFSERGCLGVAY